jgi:hypothetical protein
MKEIVLDLETYRTRDPRVVSRITMEARAKRPAQNTAKELKMVWDTPGEIERRVSEALDKTAVDVLYAEPLVCCMLVDGLRKGGDCEIDMMESPEKEQLKVLAHFLGDTNQSTVWIGHNVEFDLAILLNRWRRWRITPPQWFPEFRGRWYGRIHDTMRNTPSANGMGYVSMSAVCDSVGLPEAKATMWEGAPMDGSRVGDAYRAQAYDIIREYCQADVAVTRVLYEIQTAGKTDKYTECLDALRALDDEPMGEGARAIAKLNVLDGFGFVPR